MMTGTATTHMAILDALKSGKEMALDDLDASLDIERRYIVNSSGRLIYAGLIERAEKGVYKITDAGLKQLASGEPIRSGKTGQRNGVRRVRAGGLRQRLWNAMRAQNGAAFSLPDLLTIALNDGEESAHTYSNANQYLRQLIKTGYLKKLNRRQPGTRPGSNGFQLYKLDRDSGDQAPVSRVRRKEVFDRNTREVRSWA